MSGPDSRVRKSVRSQDCRRLRYCHNRRLYYKIIKKTLSNTNYIVKLFGTVAILLGFNSVGTSFPDGYFQQLFRYVFLWSSRLLYNVWVRLSYIIRVDYSFAYEYFKKIKDFRYYLRCFYLYLLIIDRITRLAVIRIFSPRTFVSCLMYIYRPIPWSMVIWLVYNLNSRFVDTITRW